MAKMTACILLPRVTSGSHFGHVIKIKPLNQTKDVTIVKRGNPDSMRLIARNARYYSCNFPF